MEVDDRAIRNIGNEATLEQVVAGWASSAAGVRSFVRKWRARRDSNSRPPIRKLGGLLADLIARTIDDAEDHAANALTPYFSW